MECTEGGTSADNGRTACGREAKTVLASTRIASTRTSWYQPVVLDGVIGIVQLFGTRFVLSLQAHNLPNRRRTMLSELSEHCSLKNFPLLKVKMLFEWVF